MSAGELHRRAQKLGIDSLAVAQLHGIEGLKQAILDFDHQGHLFAPEIEKAVREATAAGIWPITSKGPSRKKVESRDQSGD